MESRMEECFNFVKPIYNPRMDHVDLENAGYSTVPGCMDGSLRIKKPDLFEIEGRYSTIEVRDPVGAQVVFHPPLEGGEEETVEELRKGFMNEVGTRLQVLPPSSNNPVNIQRMNDVHQQSTRGLDIAERGGYQKWSRVGLMEKYPVDVHLPSYGQYGANKQRIMNINQPRGFLNTNEQIEIRLGQADAPASAYVPHSTSTAPPGPGPSPGPGNNPLGGGSGTVIL